MEDNLTKIEQAILKEERRIEKYNQQKNDLEEKINKAVKHIEELRLSANSEKFKLFNEAASKAGLSFDDIMKSLQNGTIQQMVNETGRDF